MSHGILETIYNKYASTFHSKNSPLGTDRQRVEKQQRREREERVEGGRGAARWKN